MKNVIKQIISIALAALMVTSSLPMYIPVLASGADMKTTDTASLNAPIKAENMDLAVEYTVMFDVQGGLGGIRIKTVTFNRMYGDLPVPEKTDCIFDGWYTSPGGGGSNINSSTVVSIPNDHVLYAKWISINGCTITFDADGGYGGTCDSLTPEEPLTAPIVTKTGYTFTGWSPSVSPKVPSVDTTYIAQWAINSYTINFNANSGEGYAPPINQTYGTNVILPTAGFTKANHTFIGWNTSSHDTTALSSNFTIPAYNITLYAVYTYSCYNLKLNSNDGTGSIFASYSFPVGTNISFYDSYSSGTVVLNQQATYEYNKRYIKLIYPYNYLFEFSRPDYANAHMGDLTKIYDYDLPIRSGYEFLGWSVTPTGQPLSNFTMPASDITLYAVWKKNSVSLTTNSSSRTRLNESKHFIYGLAEGMDKDDFINNYVHVSGEGDMRIVGKSETLGTGTKVELIDNRTGTVADTYTIIIFGDVDGDGFVTAQDENQIRMAAAYQTTFGEGSAYENAADINKDGVIDMFDLNIIRAALTGITPVDQTNEG